MRTKEYFVDDSFQRRLVWTTKQKVRLIETILINYPMPEIYLWQQAPDPESGNQLFSIVDGQQRLTTITQFASNEFALKASFLDDENQEADFANKFWKDLSDERKKGIWEYIINVRQIPSQVTIDEVRRVFTRLNETDRSLNPQELRNAEFNGEFITNAERLADIDLWKKWEFFPPGRVRRMGDIEYCSNLLVFLRSGVVEDAPASLNQVYDLYNDKYEDRDADYNDAVAVLTRIDKLAETEPAIKKLFLSNVHLYALFAVLHSGVGKLSDMDLAAGLKSFALEYGNHESLDKLIIAYREGASSRTKSKSSREKRVDSLRSWLEQMSATKN